MEPDLTREGGSIPVTLTFQEATGKNVMLLPIGACDDGAHSQNEKIDRSNYINGVSMFKKQNLSVVERCIIHMCDFTIIMYMNLDELD